jgi:MFS family permease
MAPSRYRWVIVAAGGLLGCVAVGAMFALPVFLRPISKETGWSITGLSAAMTIGFLALALGSIAWGSLSDRFGPRAIVLAGSVLLAIGLGLASMAPSLLVFQLLFGLMVGAATAAIFAPMMACVTGWFDTHRSLAVSLVSAGMGMAPVTMSPFAAWLISIYDWRTAFQIIAVFVAVVMIPVSLLVRRPPALEAAPAMAGEGAAPQPQMSVRDAVRSPQFLILLATNFFCCATHSGPIIHTVSYAQFCGIAPAYAVTIYSAEGVGGLFGRVVLGLAGDRFGAKPVLIAGLLVQAVGAGAYMFAPDLASFYAIALVFGFAYGGVMPLYAVLARDYFGPNIMGAVFGAAAMISSLGMALGPVIGGWIFDTFHDYRGLYISSLVVGLGAAAIALAFPPQPSRVRLATA